MNIGLNMPFGTAGIKLIDFIVGIQKKFNLVMYPNKTKLNDFIIEPFNTWYKQGRILDFNRYINLDENIEVIPANNFAVQNLNFGDTLDQDYISQQFNRGANREFGKAYYIDTQNFFSQGDYTVKTTLASSPLIYLQGTGVSASIAPPPVAYPIGDGSLSYSSNLSIVCSTLNVYSLYSSTGTVEPSAVLYYDANGDVVVTGYRFLVIGCDIWQINQTTGVILSYIGSCADYGGCP